MRSEANDIADVDALLAQGLARLLYAYTQNAGERPLLAALSELTGCPAVLLDANFMVVSQSDQSAVYAELEFRAYPFVSEIGPLAGDAPRHIPGSDMLITPVLSGGQTSGCLILQNIAAPVSHAAKELSLAAARLSGRSMLLPAPTDHEAILLELLSTARLTMDMRLRIHSAGMSFDQPKRVVVFEAGRDDPLFENLRAKLPPGGGYSVRFKDALVLLADASDSAIWDKTRESLARAAEEVNLRCGISDVFSGVQNVPEQCRNAFQAIAFAERFQLGGSVFEYADFRFFDLLAVFDQPRELFRYMHPALQKLRDIDAKSGAAYFHTLHCFLKFDTNLSQTAKSLFIHRNTLNYRLKRIEELTGLALDDSKTRFTLNYSYHIAEYLGLADI